MSELLSGWEGGAVLEFGFILGGGTEGIGQVVGVLGSGRRPATAGSLRVSHGQKWRTASAGTPAIGHENRNSEMRSARSAAQNRSESLAHSCAHDSYFLLMHQRRREDVRFLHPAESLFRVESVVFTT